jgi:uncharacterized protein (DUF58 family)
MDTKELLKRIRRIQIRTSHMANDVFAGQYRSAFKGQGMEFEEVREYQPGDEIRSIDWNVTARQGRPFIKRFREERELTVMLMLDISGSQQFGTSEQLKRELATEVGATLAFSAIKNNDKVGLIGFSDSVEKFVKPDKGLKHVLHVIREMLALEGRNKGTNLAAAFEYLNRVVTRRAVVFVISDFFSPAFDRQMRVARRRHDIIPVCISDQREATLPNVRFMELMDNETGEILTVDTSSRRFRSWYEDHSRQNIERLQKTFRKMRVDMIELRTGASYVEPLTRFFRAREARL